MRWVTRSGIHIDRAASAWLIARFIDTDAVFAYVDDPADRPGDATAFDMADCELTHHDDDITFETILRTYELDDPVLWAMAEIFHQADLEDDRFDAPEADGFDLIVRALGVDHDDEAVRTITATIFDSTYHYLRRRALGRHDHA